MATIQEMKEAAAQKTQNLVAKSDTNATPQQQANPAIDAYNKKDRIAALKAELSSLGEEFVITPVEKFAKETVRYFSKIPGMRYVFGDGQEIVFAHGRADIGPDIPGMNGTFTHTNEKHADNGEPVWKIYQKELNNILGKQTNIFIPEVAPTTAPAVTQNALTDQEAVDKEAALKNSGLKTKVLESPTGAGTSGLPTDANQSTVDPAIRYAMMGEISTDGAATRAANLNAGAMSSSS